MRPSILSFTRPQLTPCAARVASCLFLILAVAPVSQAQSPVPVTEAAYARRVGASRQGGPSVMSSVTFGVVAPVSKGIGLGAGILDPAAHAAGSARGSWIPQLTLRARRGDPGSRSSRCGLGG